MDELDKKLRALSRATDDVRPTDAFTGALVGGLEATDPLRVLGAATDGLAPAEGFDDAVMARIMSEAATSAGQDASEAALVRAAGATAELRPTDAFSDAVLAAIAKERVAPPATAVGFYDGVTRSARSGLFFAAAAAAACVLLSWYTQRDFDTQLMLQAENVEESE